MPTDKNYDDIINLPHPTSKTHPRMSMYNRAAQFAPFAALSGYGDAVNEAERQTEAWRELDESEKARLDEKLQILSDNLEMEPAIRVTCFVPDEKKSGGQYVEYTGNLKKIDDARKMLIMTDGAEIPSEQVFDIQCDLFAEYGLTE